MEVSIMKKNYFKGLIQGLIIGIIISTFAVSFAVSAIKEAFFNTEIKTNYNGQPVNIEKITVVKEGEVNGRTFGSINDIAIALGKSVSWDNATKTINITDTEVKDMSTITETDGKAVNQEESYIYEKDGFYLLKYNNEDYVSISEVHSKFPECGWTGDPETKIVGFIAPGSDEVSIYSVPYIEYHRTKYIKYDYYINTILPLIQ
jgi:hypothetical protein